MEEISVIKNGTVITPFKMIKNGVVVFEDGRIITVGQEKDVETPKEAKAIDASYEAINKLAKFKASHGTTAFLQPPSPRHTMIY